MRQLDKSSCFKILQKFVFGIVLSYMVTSQASKLLPELFADYFHAYFSPSSKNDPRHHDSADNLESTLLKIDAGWNSSDLQFMRRFLSLVHEEYADVTSFSEISSSVPKPAGGRHNNVTRNMELLMANFDEEMGEESSILLTALSFLSKRLHFQCHEKTLTSRLMHVGDEIKYVKGIYDNFNGSTAYLVKNGGFVDVRKFSVPWELTFNLVSMVHAPLSRISQVYVADRAEKSLMCQFCGSIAHCNQTMSDLEENAALHMVQLAKANVETYYAVVGLSNQPEKSLILLEAMMPRFFEGVAKLYPDLDPPNYQKYEKKLVETTKIDVSVMSTPAFANEVEFYQFLTQRFFIQLEQHGQRQKQQRMV